MAARAQAAQAAVVPLAGVEAAEAVRLDPDAEEERARKVFGLAPDVAPTGAQLEAAQAAGADIVTEATVRTLWVDAAQRVHGVSFERPDGSGQRYTRPGSAAPTSPPTTVPSPLACSGS